MTTSPTHRRALIALGTLVVVAAVSVPSALAAIGTDNGVTALGAPTHTRIGDGPASGTAPGGAASSPDAALRASAADDDAAAIADAIIQRLQLPTGPVLSGPPPAPVSEPAPAAPAAPAAPPATTATDADTPRDRTPSRNGSDDRIEVEVYGAALPEPPEVASSTTTETVLVEPDPSDPWRAVRECESSGNYRVNTGNGFYGAYQFTIRTWNWVAGIIDRPDLIGVRPDLASPADQDRMANALAFEVRGGGLGHWPICGRLYGS